MNERHKGQLKIAHQLYDNRDLKQELLYQREFLDTGYLSYQQVCFNKWIFDECLKRLEERKVGKWIYHEKSISTGFKNMRECSCCHCYFRWEMPRNSYCPNCGAEMEDEE
jgi:uncharacterized paraquat-inducible protein A